MFRYWKRALYTFREIRVHPLTRHATLQAAGRWLGWQIGSRLVGGKVVVPMAAPARILVGPGMHGATMNVFTGLADFEEMGFLLHYLRESDLFVDIGANVGVFGVLAGAVAGSRVILFEPGKNAFEGLVDNIRLNGLETKARVIQKVVSDSIGTVAFTSSLDTLNHVAEGAEDGVSVETTTLDHELAKTVPAAMKIDVEGFEHAVLAGAKKTLSASGLGAIVMELGSHSLRYGIDPEETFAMMLDFGFVPASYNPLARRLKEQPKKLDTSRANTLFVRDFTAAQCRVKDAPAFSVLGRTV